MLVIDLIQALATVYIAATSLWFWLLVGGFYLTFGYSFWLASARYSPFSKRSGPLFWLALGGTVALGVVLAVKGFVLERYLYHFPDEKYFLLAGALALSMFAAMYTDRRRREVPHWPADLLATVLAALAYIVAILT